ncbi:Pectin lyase-like superfamily protein [Dorcoceras hygrometricum]|uniref:Pectin lyase-like superfamily protein n=1 Tax=Dorcoceras hygrometricum TaxID=472368 RepID=A0A2Z7CCZ7_9LAMI|nr:Pectin lyase-like superfamily protein [Dorcoceras hygrometricum]
MESTCNGRSVGGQWRQNPMTRSAYLSKKKDRKHGSNYLHHGHAGKSPRKAHSPKAPPPPLPPAMAPPLVPPHTRSPPPPPVPTVGHKGSPPPPNKGEKPSGSAVYNVLEFGAKGDGTTDDTKAFQAAWAAACKVEASILKIPAENVFLVGPISFSGPYCQHNIIFQLDGKIVAPKSSKAWGSGLLQWLEFTKLVGITVTGSGTIDGNGAVWWQDSSYEDDPLDGQSMEQSPPISLASSSGEKMPRIKPTNLLKINKYMIVNAQALRFYGSFNVTVTGISIQNSPQCHLKFDNCNGVSVYNFSVSSPGDSPNTDGIHLQNSKDVLIRNSNLACGDDCVSIQTGCTNIYIHDVNCGPGHGISIGGLGKDNTKACVSNVTVRDVLFQETTNGVRIKTWQGGLGSVQGIRFSNIQVSQVQLPIIIDQYYCDARSCKNQTSAVAVSGVRYENIRGTYTVSPVHLACSDGKPCTDVTLTSIDLKPQKQRFHMYDPYCWQAFGKLLSPINPPVNCLRIGKPATAINRGNNDSC